MFDKVDTEPPRFLDFERWWGGYYLMNTEEIEWITRNLFVGNKLWSGDVKGAAGKAFDLREIKAPIVLFASMGDNITPPQQAFNWVADVYESTEEIKARGQVIVGLLHEDIGHLGIFVSGKVAKKEHAQIVSVLETIERLPPGLYGMEINEHKGSGGQVEYEVEFRERRLEDIAAVINRFERADEKAFEAVASVSDFNQRAYELFARPFVQAMSNEQTAKMLRDFHPLRLQNWAFSSRVNPWLSWLAPAAEAVKAHRQAVADDHPLRQAEHAGAEVVSASLDYYRALRDAMTEASFFSLYANARRGTAGARGRRRRVADAPAIARGARRRWPRSSSGGYVEALARVAFLIGCATGRAVAAVAPRNAPGAGRRVRRSAAADDAVRLAHASAASRKSSRATSRSAPSRRCRCCSPIPPTAQRLLTLLDESWPTGASRNRLPSRGAGGDVRADPQRCSRARVARRPRRLAPPRAHAAEKRCACPPRHHQDPRHAHQRQEDGP